MSNETELQPSTTSPEPAKTAEETLFPASQEAPKAEAWAEYTPDPAKSAEENAAAKVEHDKGKPAEEQKEAPKAEPLTAESIKIPEGFEVEPEVMNKFLETMNDAELSPADRAQRLVDLQTDLLQKVSEKGNELWDKQVEQWETEVKEDPAIGGKNFDSTMTSIGKLLDHYNVPGVREAFDTTRSGSNPAIVRLLAAIAKDFSEGQPAQGKPADTSNDPAKTMFPNMK